MMTEEDEELDKEEFVEESVDEGVGIDFAFEEEHQSLLMEEVLICCLRDVDNGRSWII